MSDNSHPDPPTPSPTITGPVVPDPSSMSSGCPWIRKNNPVVNPRNLMPDLPQSPSQNQQTQLSTEREVSSIPKTGSGARWEYPSPQQFFHALLRRNKTAEEETMDSVVFVHNAVNEDSWKEILKYESMYNQQCREPSLQRFVGKSEDPSPKAWVRTKLRLGDGEELFDRHDWFVDRCGLKTVRYVIDYYDTSESKHADGNFNVRIDARPALDSFEAAWDRIRMPLLQWWNSK